MGAYQILERIDAMYETEFIARHPEYMCESAWMEHAPFAFWLVKKLRPERIVELGSYSGYSYFSFCEAVKRADLSSVTYAIDTWTGDRHSGYYDDNIYQEFIKYNSENYASFSKPLKTTFQDALNKFEDSTVDLLHIDGLHTYEAVKNDFESWAAKLSNRSIVLFHYIEVKRDDFGVYRLWEELKSNYKTFTFNHNHGLGVLKFGESVPDEVNVLFNFQSDEKKANEFRGVFEYLGRSITEKMNNILYLQEIKKINFCEKNYLSRLENIVYGSHAGEPKLLKIKQKIYSSPFSSHGDIPLGFNPLLYILKHEDLFNAEVDPYEHYINFGQFEKREIRSSFNAGDIL